MSGRRVSSRRGTPPTPTRRTERIGVACVTYGVGSFSLYNAVAGAFVERCPVVVLNGTANADKTRQFKEQGVLFAHAIDPLRTDELIFRPITAATAVVTDPYDAPGQIDRVLRACVAESRPVYLEVPDGVWVLPCAARGPAGGPTAPAVAVVAGRGERRPAGHGSRGRCRPRQGTKRPVPGPVGRGMASEVSPARRVRSAPSS